MVQEMPAQTGVAVGGEGCDTCGVDGLGAPDAAACPGRWQRDPSTCMAPSEILLKGRGSPCFGHNFYLFYLLLHARHNLPG